MAGRLTDRGLDRVADATRTVEGLARSSLNALAGGRLPAGDAQQPVWRVRCTGSPLSDVPDLFPGELLRLAYDPARPPAAGRKAAWYAPDAPPRLHWKRNPDGSFYLDPVSGQRVREYGFFDPAEAGRPAPDLGPVWLVPPDPDATLAIGDEGVGVVVGEHDGRPILAVVGGGGSGQVVVQATAANAGAQWTTGLVQRFTATGDLTAASPFEAVELKPLHESDRLVNGQSYLCVDTGVRGDGGRRRLRAERLGGGGLPAGFREITVVTSVGCIGDAVHATTDRAYAPPSTP